MKCPFQITGTSSDCRKKKKTKNKKSTAEPDSEESYLRSSSPGNERRNVTQSFTPSTPPPPTAASFRTANRRKGVPHRASFGTLLLGLEALRRGLYPQFEEQLNDVNWRSNHRRRIGRVLLGVNPVHAAFPPIATADPRKYASQRMASKMDG
ncbi:hypothetical protein GW17_00031765 [Ensete ventricosum]|nr:hypothetical protein GW17_00031765 [Ensete ventricosum]